MYAILPRSYGISRMMLSNKTKLRTPFFFLKKTNDGQSLKDLGLVIWKGKRQKKKRCLQCDAMRRYRWTLSKFDILEMAEMSGEQIGR
jgi:hypothetical protein